jgi:hypothetical protein
MCPNIYEKIKNCGLCPNFQNAAKILKKLKILAYAQIIKMSPQIFENFSKIWCLSPIFKMCPTILKIFSKFGAYVNNFQNVDNEKNLKKIVTDAPIVKMCSKNQKLGLRRNFINVTKNIGKKLGFYSPIFKMCQNVFEKI